VIAQRVAAEKAKEEAQRERIRAEEAARLEREAAAKAAAEKAEANRLEQEAEADRARAAKVEADRIAREQAEAVSAARIREEQTPAPSVQTYDNGAPMYSTTTFKDNGQPIMLTPDGKRSIFCDVADDEEPTDNGARLTLGQLNDRLAPVSINVAGLSTLGFDPVEQVKASRFYRECDLPAICKAISAHVMAACATEVA